MVGPAGSQKEGGRGVEDGVLEEKTQSRLAYLSEVSSQNGMPVLGTLEERASKRRAYARICKLRLKGTTNQEIEDQ
eukprot:11989704-Alexandrium_andersonii.AAC.1